MVPTHTDGSRVRRRVDRVRAHPSVAPVGGVLAQWTPNRWRLGVVVVFSALDGPTHLELHLFLVAFAFVFDAELSAPGHADALTGDLDAKGGVGPARVRQPAELRHKFMH